LTSKAATRQASNTKATPKQHQHTKMKEKGSNNTKRTAQKTEGTTNRRPDGKAEYYIQAKQHPDKRATKHAKQYKHTHPSQPRVLWQYTPAFRCFQP
jgi:hypothetical protein